MSDLRWLEDPKQARFEPSDEPGICGHYVWEENLALPQRKTIIRTLKDEEDDSGS